jgi:lysyl-tRNA synthetase class 2
VDIVGVNSVQPVVTLNMMGASASLNSVKLEIMQRIQRHFMQPGLKVDWKSEEADMEFD